MERRQVLEKLHDKNNIEGTYILSDFPSIDFSDCIVRKSTFRHFRDLFNCKINEGTKFIDCYFMDCTEKFRQQNIRSQSFIECKLDEGMRHLLYDGDEKRVGISVKIKSDVKQVLVSGMIRPLHSETGPVRHAPSLSLPRVLQFCSEVWLTLFLTLQVCYIRRCHSDIAQGNA